MTWDTHERAATGEVSVEYSGGGEGRHQLGN